MKLEAVKRILLAQSAEESDPDEKILPTRERQAASSGAGAPLPEKVSRREENDFLDQRSRRVVSFLTSKHAAFAKIANVSVLRHFGTVSTILVIVAAVFGFLTNELGARERINILAFPLLGIIIWNLIVYLGEIIRLFRRSNPDQPLSGPAGWITSFLNRTPKTDADDGTPPEIRQATALFSTNWSRAIAPILGAKTKSLLHIAAAILGAAAIAGMYVKGLANEYQAVWESTFFTAETLQPFLKTVLGPASAISQISLPEIESLKKMGPPNYEAPQPAAPWIHLYAITMGIFVIIPRSVLSLIWHLRSVARQNSIPFREFAPGYFERLLTVSSGDSLVIKVIPYAHQPTDDSRSRIQREAEQLISGPVTLDWSEPIHFGEEDTIPEEITTGLDSLPTEMILLFNFAATPERETHGEIHQKIEAALIQRGSATQLHTFLDAESFDRKAESFPDFKSRRETRLDGWKNLLGSTHAETLRVISI